MGEEIKSAREIVEEKIKELGEPTEEERLRWKYVPEGEQLSARYLRQDVNLSDEIGKYDEKARQYLTEGATEVLLRNIKLPQTDADKKSNRRAMEGIKALKKNKVAVENVFSQMRRVFEHYQGQGEQQQKQAYEALKADFAAQVQAAIKQQYGTLGDVNLDIESQPQFQEEWRKMQARLNEQYLKLLNEYKLEIAALD